MTRKPLTASNSFRLIEVEKVTKATLEYFVKNILEGFLTLFHNSGSTIHLVYGSICHNLIKVMRRFTKARSLDWKYEK